MKSSQAHQEMLLGNEAIGRGLAEAGCHFVTSYPGTPSSEILPAVVAAKKRENLNIYVNWAVNEKIAFDEALAAAYTGKRSAVIMKQVGLNVASDSMMSAAYTGVKGGMIIISADDPGPHSSQTEQDSRLFGHFAKIPVFDPATPKEAMEMIRAAFEISEKYQIPALLRPSLRVCHARTNIPLSPIQKIERKAEFEKNPQRWAATPKFRFVLHQRLNEKLKDIRAEFENTALNQTFFPDAGGDLGIIAGGISFAVVMDLLKESGLDGRFSVLKIGTSHPLPEKRVDRFVQSHKRVLVLEEPDAAIEIQIADKSALHGRLDGSVPSEGELTPGVVARVLAGLGVELPGHEESGRRLAEIDALSKDMGLPPRPPTLCPGCGHRAAFYAIRKTFPKAIFPSDIGCYTLGLNLKAVDTILDMGAGLTIATGLFHAYRQDGEAPPIVATMGDSTFFHSGLPALVDAVYNGARFVFVLLDNHATAMTGMQPTPADGVLADGSRGNRVDIAGLIRACGVDFVETVDPYDLSRMMDALKEAGEHTLKENGGMAAVIARHPCLIAHRDQIPKPAGKIRVSEDCDGCRYCVSRFECPALVYDEETETVRVNEKICSGCAVCVDVCPNNAIFMEEDAV